MTFQHVERGSAAAHARFLGLPTGRGPDNPEVPDHGDLERLIETLATRHREIGEWFVEQMIDRLDTLDGDPDLECDEDCSIEDQPHDSEPNEPSLGSLDRALDQRRWAAGDATDLERDGFRRVADRLTVLARAAGPALLEIDASNVVRLHAGSGRIGGAK